MFPAGRESRILTDHGKDAHTGTTLPFWEIAQSRGLKLLISYASGYNLFWNLCVIDFNLSNISSSPVSFYNVTQKALSNPIYKRTFLRIKGMGYWVHVFSLALKLCFICELLMTFARWPWLLQKTHHIRNSTVKVLSLFMPGLWHPWLYSFFFLIPLKFASEWLARKYFSVYEWRSFLHLKGDPRGLLQQHSSQCTQTGIPLKPGPENFNLSRHVILRWSLLTSIFSLLKLVFMETKWSTEVLEGTPGSLSLLGLSKCCLTIALPWTRDSQPSPCSSWSSPGLSTEKICISNLRQISDTHSFQISQLEHFMIKTEPGLESFLHQLLCVAQGHKSPLGCSTQSVETTALMWMHWAVLSPSG